MMILQVGSSKADAVWVYTLTYGGGIVTVCTTSYLIFLSSFLGCIVIQQSLLHVIYFELFCSCL